MINTQSLQQPLLSQSPRELDVLSTEYEVLSHHLARAQYVEAASVAERLWADGVHDVRILGHYLFGIFIERGLAGLSALFDLIEIALGDSWPHLAPLDRRERHSDAALRWLFGQVVHHIEHHKRDRDAHWEQWQSPGHKDTNDAAYRRGQALAMLLEERLPRGRCIQALYHLQSLLHQLHIESAVSSGFKVSAEAEIRAQEEARRRAMLPVEEAADSTSSATSETSDESDERHEHSPSNTSGSNVSSSESTSFALEPSRSDSESSKFDSESSGSHTLPPAVSSSFSMTAPSDASAAALPVTPESGEPAVSRLSDATLSSGVTLSSQSVGLTQPAHLSPVGSPARPSPFFAGGPETAASVSAPGEESPPVAGGPELKGLLRRLALLEVLCRRGQFRAAAVLLSDIQRKLSEFDPVRYFPSLFSDYLRALVTHGDALTRAQSAGQEQLADIRLSALRQLLHNDVELFAQLAQDLP